MQIKLLPKKILGQTIRGIRMRLGMSPADFASSLGVAEVGEVSKWERGTVQPDYGTLARIAAMGMVDALVFHERDTETPQPQLTPGEATDLAGILVRMEALLAEARTLVDRATRRTAVELLDAATNSPRAQIVDEGALVLDAEVRLEAKPRTRSRTASASRRASGTAARTRTTRSRSGGSSNGASSRSSNSTSSGSSSNASKSGSGSGSGNGGSKSSRSRSGSSRSGSASGSNATSSSSSSPQGSGASS